MSEYGPFYSAFVDPVLKRMRKRVVNHIAEGQTVLDVACGTGAQLFESAWKVKNAVGIDYSESMIHQAKKNLQKHNHSHIEFIVHDVTEEWPFEDHQFDVAVLSLALHQFSPNNYFIILNEMRRVASRQVFLDYAVPLPRNVVGTGSKVAEFFAGREHHRNFRHYNRLGGLQAILPGYRLALDYEEYIAKNTFHLVVCS